MWYMVFPEKFPGLKLLKIVMGVLAAVWMVLESGLWLTIGLGVGGTAVILLHLLQKKRAQTMLSRPKWIALSSSLGLLLGLASPLVILLLMVLKTGLHAHGPEFSPAQINWVIRQIPLWTISGLLAGAGLGLLTSSLN